jgi:hypothetical protein
MPYLAPKLLCCLLLAGTPAPTFPAATTTPTSKLVVLSDTEALAVLRQTLVQIRSDLPSDITTEDLPAHLQSSFQALEKVTNTLSPAQRQWAPVTMANQAAIQWRVMQSILDQLDDRTLCAGYTPILEKEKLVGQLKTELGPLEFAAQSSTNRDTTEAKRKYAELQRQYIAAEADLSESQVEFDRNWPDLQLKLDLERKTHAERSDLLLSQAIAWLDDASSKLQAASQPTSDWIPVSLPTAAASENAPAQTPTLAVQHQEIQPTANEDPPAPTPTVGVHSAIEYPLWILLATGVQIFLFGWLYVLHLRRKQHLIDEQFRKGKGRTVQDGPGSGSES